MNLVLVTAPSIDPVSYEEVETHLRLDVDASTAESALVDGVIAASISYVENVTRRALTTQTWDMYLDEFPSGNSIKLPLGNLQSVTHVKYTNSSAVQATMTATTEYLVETNGDQCGRVVLPYGATWPSFTAYTTHPIVIRFVCGWTSAALVPYPIKAAIKLICADLYSNREAQSYSPTAQAFAINKTVENMLFNYRLWDEF